MNNENKEEQIVNVVPDDGKNLTENQDWWRRLFGFAFLSEGFRKEIEEPKNSENFSDILIASKEYTSEPENENKKVKITNIENGEDGKPSKITFSVDLNQDMEAFKKHLQDMGLKIVENKSTKSINNDTQIKQGNTRETHSETESRRERMQQRHLENKARR